MATVLLDVFDGFDGFDDGFSAFDFIPVYGGMVTPREPVASDGVSTLSVDFGRGR